MNFALPAVIVILGLIPGILFHKAYFSGKFPREIASESAITEFAQYFVFALPLDAFGLSLLREDQRQAGFQVLIDILSLDLTSAQTVDDLVAVLSRSWLPASLGYFGFAASAFGVGVLLRRIVWTLRLDVRFPSLRMKVDWYYFLQGRLPHMPRQVLPYADVLAAHPEGSRLYRGLVTRFSFTNAGEIRELILGDASRGKGRGDEFKWVPIPSDQFLLLGSHVHSINMRYFELAPKAPGRWARLLRQSKLLLYSFLFEEP